MFRENLDFFEFYYFKKSLGMRGMKRHSTSPPCGNLVDDLPHACHTETVAKPDRLGPAQNGEPMQHFVRVIEVLLDEVYEDAKKMLSSVY